MAIATAIDCNDPPTMIVACQLLAGLAVLEYILSFLLIILMRNDSAFAKNLLLKLTISI